MTRIEVIGCSGGGKSTLARRIAQRLGLEFIGLDGLVWKPGWVLCPPEERAVIIAAACAKDRRVVDGTYSSNFAGRFKDTDLVVWIDQPRRVCLRRVLLRCLKFPGQNRPEVPAGCPERLDPAFLLYIWNFNRETGPRIEAALDSAPFAWVRLRSDREIAAFECALYSAVEAGDRLDDAILVGRGEIRVHWQTDHRL